jgi:hypothetical protein
MPDRRAAGGDRDPCRAQPGPVCSNERLFRSGGFRRDRLPSHDPG